MEYSDRSNDVVRKERFREAFSVQTFTSIQNNQMFLKNFSQGLETQGSSQWQEDKSLVEVEFSAYRNQKQLPRAPSRTLLGSSVSQVSLENFLSWAGGLLDADIRLLYLTLLCFLSPDAEFQVVTSKWPAVWVKISSSWVCLLLYVWTLVAPIVLTNRDFS